MVDTVLYFDEATRGYRFVRTAKNRFGPAGELGIFEMTGAGLEPITEPGQYFKSSTDEQSGCMMTVAMEGNRPLRVELQALVTPSRYGTPQRSATGFSGKRLYMLLAVLEKKIGLPLGTQDVFVNVAGGLQLDDPGADLALSLALASSFYDKPLPGGVALGEVGLTGDLRPAALLDQRIKECLRLNTTPVVTGGGSGSNKQHKAINEVASIAEAVKLLLE
jgi:DNA repair protein RadA/Sms